MKEEKNYEATIPRVFCVRGLDRFQKILLRRWKRFVT
jgi:hypothetical protein